VPDFTMTLTGRLDPRSGWRAAQCPIARALDVVHNRSAFLILREAFYGTTRFDDFGARVGISESVAAARLKDLVAAGLLEQQPYRDPGERTRQEYRLTEMGADFLPVLAAMMQWGERWLGPARVRMQHHDCGGDVRAEVRCASGHELTPGDIDLVLDTPDSARS
jgi:DNA-binding HxlR family transcriptional regulator